LIRVIKQNTAYARPGAGRRRRRAGQSGSGQGRSSSVRPPSAALSKQE
jgi:hypothetical protein